MPTPNPKVDAYLNRIKHWQKEQTLLRTLLAKSTLTEDLKWGHPCYTLNDKNVILIHGFKDYCALLFLKGALLQDPQKILIRQTEQVQSARQIRFTSIQEIKKLTPTLKKYIQAAIAVEAAGLKVQLKKPADYPIPEEFQSALNANAALQTAFHSLTPGRQRAYLLHFNNAKQSTTRQSRIEKYTPHILQGKGMDDE